jgi:hypothetical protein
MQLLTIHPRHYFVILPSGKKKNHHFTAVPQIIDCFSPGFMV